MNIERALEIVKAKDRPIRVPPNPHPEGCTLWNVPVGALVQEAVYFAYSAGRIKIGHSIIARQRAADLAPGSPHPLVMVLIVPGSLQDERKFHKRFHADRIHHEWFHLSKKMRDFLKARLCPIGRASLGKAEDEFRVYCKGMVP